nr:hypothetical protein [Mucilaginibacter sp. L294]
MSIIAFFGVPTHGHVNPTLGLVSELINNGETVIYFTDATNVMNMNDTFFGDG